MRIFHLVRFNHRYPDREIVCDRCSENLNVRYYYNIYENGALANEYPFHSRSCGRTFIREELVETLEIFNVIVVLDGNKDFLQEEETED